MAAALAVALAAFRATAAHAAILATSDCSASGHLTCRLTGVLDILYIIAAILGFVLLAAIVLAVRIYRKNIAEDERRRP